MSLLSGGHRLKQINQGLAHKMRDVVNIRKEGTENTSNPSGWFSHSKNLPLSHFPVNFHICMRVCVCLVWWCGKWVLLRVPDPAMVRCVSDDGCGGDLWGLYRFSTVWPQECHPWNPSSPWSAGTWAGKAQRCPARWEPSACRYRVCFRRDNS